MGGPWAAASLLDGGRSRGQATDRIVHLYDSLGFTLEYHDAPRMISCNGDRTRAREVLALKNIAGRGA